MIVVTSMILIDFVLKIEVTKTIWDSILIYITEFSIKSCACTQIFRAVKKIFSRFSSYLLWGDNGPELVFCMVYSV